MVAVVFVRRLVRRLFMYASPSRLVTLDNIGPDPASTAFLMKWLVETYLDDVYRYAYRLSGNRSDAEDVAQQVFLQAQRHLDQVRDRSRLRPWLLRIVRNIFFKLHRRQRPQNASTLNVNLDWFPDRTATDQVDVDAVQAALNKLDSNHKQIVLMYFFEDLSYQQIADRLCIKIGTVMSRLSRAKACLREIFSSQLP